MRTGNDKNKLSKNLKNDEHRKQNVNFHSHVKRTATAAVRAQQKKDLGYVEDVGRPLTKKRRVDDSNVGVELEKYFNQPSSPRPSKGKHCMA